jgi:hypothetical protein
VVVRDLLQKTDAELAAMLQAIDHETLDWTPVIISELMRRSLVRLADSSRRLGKLTWWLIALTIVLCIVALPPAIEMVAKLLR